MDLETQTYFGAIAWSENDKGEYDARDLISLLDTIRTLETTRPAPCCYI